MSDSIRYQRMDDKDPVKTPPPSKAFKFRDRIFVEAWRWKDGRISELDFMERIDVIIRAIQNY